MNLRKKQSLSNRKPEIDWGRSRITNIMVFKQHFHLLEQTIDRITTDWLNLRNKPPSIFYCNEWLITMDRKKRLAYQERQSKLMLKPKERENKISWYPMVMAPMFQIWLKINLCRRNSIHMCCLTPHTTLVFQTLTAVIFHPLKAYFNRITQNLKLATLTGRNQTFAARLFPQNF